MTRVVEVPSQFDDRSFDQFARACGGPTDERMLFDAHAVLWASPYGLVGLLVAGQATVERGGQRPQLTIPTDKDVVHYWGRTGFFEYAGEWFEVHGKFPRMPPTGSSDVLLEITPVRGADDGAVGDRRSRRRQDERGSKDRRPRHESCAHPPPSVFPCGPGVSAMGKRRAQRGGAEHAEPRRAFT